MKKAQAELPDYKLEFKYPDQATVAIQQTLMDDLVTAGVKAIMVSAVDPKATDVLNKIAGETALFTTDSDAPQTNRIAYIGSSNVLAGKQAGRDRQEGDAERRQVHGLRRPARRRQLQGARAGLQRRPQGHRASRWSTCAATTWTRPRAKSNVEDVLTADPDINCMVGFYSYNTPHIYAGAQGMPASSARSPSSASTTTRSRSAASRKARSPAPSCSSPSSGPIRASS